MGRADYLLLGDFNAQCYQCGFKRKGSMLARNWQGYYVCPEHNEPRQPQDFVRGLPDLQTPPWTQPWPAAIFTYVQTSMSPALGDGVNKFFQLGSGLYPTTVTSVYVNGVSVGFTANATGGCTLAAAPGRYATVKGSGSENAGQ